MGTLDVSDMMNEGRRPIMGSYYRYSTVYFEVKGVKKMHVTSSHCEYGEEGSGRSENYTTRFANELPIQILKTYST